MHICDSFTDVGEDAQDLGFLQSVSQTLIEKIDDSPSYRERCKRLVIYDSQLCKDVPAQNSIKMKTSHPEP